MAERAYAWHEQLVSPARQRPELWRLLSGLMLIGAIVFGLNAVLYGAVQSVGSDAWVQAFLSGKSPMGLLVMLGSFIFVTAGVAAAARQFQKRSLFSVIGPLDQTARQFWQVFRLLLVLGLVVLVLPPYDMGAPLKPNMAFGHWLLVLPVSLVAILIQTSAEEILFRGYIQQSLAARFRSPLIWMLLPALLFAVGHYLPSQAGDNAVLIAVWSGIFGLLMADLTARAGTLGPAIALHLFNNMVALLIVALPGGLSGLALFVMPYEMSDTENLRAWLAVDFLTMFVTWLIARIALRR